MKFGLSDNIIEKINRIFSNFLQIEKAILYGSRAKGNAKNGSDIDLTLQGTNLNLSILNKIGSDLDNLLLPYTFDISIHENITEQALLEHIERVGIVFYNKEK